VLERCLIGCPPRFATKCPAGSSVWFAIHAVGFGMQAGTTEVEDARNTAHKLLCSTRTRARPGREAMRS